MRDNILGCITNELTHGGQKGLSLGLLMGLILSLVVWLQMR